VAALNTSSSVPEILSEQWMALGYSRQSIDLRGADVAVCMAHLQMVERSKCSRRGGTFKSESLFAVSA
jgi:hypothetical protein